MSWFSSLVGGAAKEPIEAIGGVLDELFTSDEEREQAKAVMEKLRQEPGKLQVALNQVEAQHRSVFVAGWRPFIGWICGLGLGFSFLFNPLLQWATAQAGPKLPTEVMMELVLAMLGLGALRTVEKLNGRTK